MKLLFDTDDVMQRRAIKAAARTLGFAVERGERSAGARFTIVIESAEDAYRLGLETMKRWRAALGRGRF